jgi:hypothetical protein
MDLATKMILDFTTQLCIELFFHEGGSLLFAEKVTN